MQTTEPWKWCGSGSFEMDPGQSRVDEFFCLEEEGGARVEKKARTSEREEAWDHLPIL